MGVLFVYGRYYIMLSKKSDWYKYGWSLDIKNQSWVENTQKEVDFIIKTLNLKGNEHILDLACGFGRHSLLFAERGFSVVGVDITKDYILDAIKSAKEKSLNNVEFIHADIRELTFENSFDVVLNLADGAIGYLENDEENLKIFDVVSRTLKSGGKHFIDVCNSEYAELHFPAKYWDSGENALSISEFDWNPTTKRMLFSSYDIPYGKILEKFDITNGDNIRLYSKIELESIYNQYGMQIVHTFSNYQGKKSSNRDLQLMVYARKL